MDIQKQAVHKLNMQFLHSKACQVVKISWEIFQIHCVFIFITASMSKFVNSVRSGVNMTEDTTEAVEAVTQITRTLS